MLAEPREELAAALDKFAIRSQVSFSFNGEPPLDVRTMQPASGWDGAPAPGTGEDEPLIQAIQSTLYDRCYARRHGGQTAASQHAPTVDPGFAKRLKAANAGREHWDKGWAIHEIGPNGQIFVRKGDRERVAVPGAFISDGVPGAAPQVGTMVSIRAPHGTFDAQPGYYHAFGETLDELADHLILTRLYFHCGAESAVSLVAELTAALNRFETPFQLKTLASPALYGRTDAAVLYVGARYFPIAARIISHCLSKISLEEAVPLFTKRLWPGVGAAVDPGSGESFGSHRCRIVAEAIVGAWRQGAFDASARIAAVTARFAAASLDLTRPWLGVGGCDPFELPPSARLP
jgi:hypothetical protein